MPRHLAIAGLLALLLGGCAEMRERLDRYNSVLKSYAGRLERHLGGAADERRVAAATPRTPSRRAARSVAAAEPPAPPPVPRPSVTVAALPPAADPDRLMGAAADRVLALLGEPAARRSEGAAQVWRYGTAGCGLEVYLFADVGDGDLHALSWKRLGPDGACPGESAAAH